MTDRERIYRSVRLDRATECWDWQLALCTSGYGNFSRPNGKKTRMILAHRFAYETFVRPLRSGEWVLHRCNNKKCCNPDHLYAGSPLDNSRDTLVSGNRLLGPKNHQSKLTADLVRGARLALAKGESQHSVARRLGVSVGAINVMALGRTWAWVK